MARSAWTDLLDPDEAALREALPDDVRPETVQELLRPAAEDGSRVRPSIRSQGSYVLGVLPVVAFVSRGSSAGWPRGWLGHAVRGLRC